MTDSVTPKKKLGILSLIDIAIVILTFVPSINANSEASSYQCQSSHSNVCIVPGAQLGVTLDTKYGVLRPLHDMAFRMYTLFAGNGSMFFDVSGLAPSPDIALQFEAQSYGNGSFDIVIKGPSAAGITADGADQRVRSVQGSWGSGVEIVYSKAVSNDLLIVSYSPFGPGCLLVCPPVGPNWLPLVAFVFILIDISAGIFRLRRIGRESSADTQAPSSSLSSLSFLPLDNGMRRTVQPTRSP